MWVSTHVRAVLDDLDRGECPTILQTSDGLPWTPPGNGLDSGVRRARLEADEAAKRSGRASAGREGLRFHDLRGTAATNSSVQACRWMMSPRSWAESSTA
ncbi:hypothetical protein NI454_08840 [Brevundimonas diminuta]|uniref:hypothetical protein n=1 Tax=Brevundimonas diminuta TaxID=293 RepID=UPI002096C79B|nr:hypothetical protein [Brevundimonas diminuta]MCO8030058.1 hypothetical protein [Brevundimonas diminuta]